jgi:formate hydrogenlyase subunit 6/NADH:ubiquinone oxidoreductase subunit I
MDLFDRLRLALRAGVVTSRYPAELPLLQAAVRGLPEVDPDRCQRDGACVAACPTGAIELSASFWAVDAGRCVMCGVCERACPSEAIRLGSHVTLAARTPEGLVHRTELRQVMEP